VPAIHLRAKFFAADVGITGANFLVAETGTSIIVTNEGNGDLTQMLPKAHIVVASIEKIVPTLEDAAQFLRVLSRSATGQDISVYTTFSTGPRRADDADGPSAYHVDGHRREHDRTRPEGTRRAAASARSRSPSGRGTQIADGNGPRFAR
jgi:L-lactate utilization protein LutB